MRATAAIFVSVLLLQVQISAATETGMGPLLGKPFPDLRFPEFLGAADYESLGLRGRDGEVKLSEITGELLVLEFFNKYCLTCWRQAPQLQTFSQLLEPGDLRGRVQILAVGAGNGPRELEEFRRRFELTYPIAPDPRFDLFYELGDSAGAPATAFLLRRAEQWILADFHVGFYGDVEMLARSRVLLKGWTRPPAFSRPEHAVDWGEDSLTREAQAFLSRVAGAEVEVEALEMSDGVRLFRARGAGGRSVALFGRAARRDPVCDLCHTIHFWIAFDDEGNVRGFEPVFVTKFGNELWSAEDTGRFRKTLDGRKAYDLPFDPDVDAVTSATMSSALIFDEIRRSARYLKELH
jgi:peroxiredoxin